MSNVPTSGKDIANLYNLVGRDFAPGKIADDVFDAGVSAIPVGLKFEVSCHAVATIAKGEDGKFALLSARIDDADTFPLDANETVMCQGGIVTNVELAHLIGGFADELLGDLLAPPDDDEIGALLDEIAKECATGPSCAAR